MELINNSSSRAQKSKSSKFAVGAVVSGLSFALLAATLGSAAPAQAGIVRNDLSTTFSTNSPHPRSTGTSSGPVATRAVVSQKQLRALRIKRSRVFVVGDSLTVGSKRAIQNSLRHKTRSVSVNAQIGRFTPAGISTLRSTKAKRANIWVVALGTNDGPNSRTAKKYVRSVMKLAGKRQVLWLTLVRPGKYYRVNATLKTLDLRYNKLTVADWAAVIKRNRQLLRGDHVHLTPRGYQIRGQYIARSVIDIAGRA